MSQDRLLIGIHKDFPPFNGPRIVYLVAVYADRLLLLEAGNSLALPSDEISQGESVVDTALRIASTQLGRPVRVVVTAQRPVSDLILHSYFVHAGRAHIVMAVDVHREAFLDMLRLRKGIVTSMTAEELRPVLARLNEVDKRIIGILFLPEEPN